MARWPSHCGKKLPVLPRRCARRYSRRDSESATVTSPRSPRSCQWASRVVQPPKLNLNLAARRPLVLTVLLSRLLVTARVLAAASATECCCCCCSLAGSSCCARHGPQNRDTEGSGDLVGYSRDPRVTTLSVPAAGDRVTVTQ